MILELDAGNTRIKWRLKTTVQTLLVQRGAVLATGSATDWTGHLCDEISAASKAAGGVISRILVSSVRDKQFCDYFGTWLLRQCGIKPEFAQSTAFAGGVHNAYSEPARLGVDRWLAVVAAFNKVKRPCCVLDCGTTITLDLVDANGRHEGGYIVPGLVLMSESLSRRTAALDVAGNFGHVEPGLSTQQAIHNGISNMVLGFVRDQRRCQLDAGKDYAWLLTGGDAEFVGANLDWKVEYVPDLVMDGLAVVLNAKEGRP